MFKFLVYRYGKNIEDRTPWSETSGGKLTPQDVYNLETYGALSPKELHPTLVRNQKRDILWYKDCATEGACYTSGY